MKSNSYVKKLKKVVKVLIGLFIFDIIYLNVIVPITLSFKQILLIAKTVLIICDERNIDLDSITPRQLEEIFNLALQKVIDIFKNNKFRLLPHAIAAPGSSELLLLTQGGILSSKSGKKVALRSGLDPVLKRQVGSIVSGDYFMMARLKDLAVENFNNISKISKEIIHAPFYLQIYIATKISFLVLNLTGINATFFRYSIWFTSSIIQLALPGGTTKKLPIILGSLARDCNFQVVDLVLNPLLNYFAPVINNFGNLSLIKKISKFVKPKFERFSSFLTLNVGTVRWYLKRNECPISPIYNNIEAIVLHFRLVYGCFLYKQFEFFNQKLNRISSYAEKLIISDQKQYMIPDSTYLIIPVTRRVTENKCLGRMNENVTALLIRNAWWKPQLKTTLKMIKDMDGNTRRSFERYFGWRWRRGDDLNLKQKLTSWCLKRLKDSFWKS